MVIIFDELTLMSQVLVAIVVPVAVLPKSKVKSLQQSDASTYTVRKKVIEAASVG